MPVITDASDVPEGLGLFGTANGTRKGLKYKGHDAIEKHIY